MNTLNTFWVYTMPLVGAWIADTYLGRYNTICLAVFIALIGHIILIVSSLPSVMTDTNGAFAVSQANKKDVEMEASKLWIRS